MKTFNVRFHGRVSGAIGICYWITDTVEAPTLQHVHENLYYSCYTGSGVAYEHVQQLSIIEGY